MTTATIVMRVTALALMGRRRDQAMRNGHMTRLRGYAVARLLRQRLYALEPGHCFGAAGGAGSGALDSELEEALDQARVLQLRRLPQLRVHRDVREAGDGVDLVQVEPVRAALQEEVDARESGGADRLERVDGDLPDLLGLLFRQLRRNHELRFVLDVLVLVVVEVASRDDFARHARLRLLVAEDRDLDLARVDAALDEHLLVGA